MCWSPDGQRIACGGLRGNFYQCDTKGVVSDSWEGVRVQAMAYRADGRRILAADTHHRIRSYRFDEENPRDERVLHEEHGIVSFTLDDSDRYALLNVAGQGMHLWDVEAGTLVRKFKGVRQEAYTVHSCFGGPRGNQMYVASGSEDFRVYVYHVRREEPVAVLSGHSRMVNAVTWNPVYPQVLASCSDDGTVRLWGPAERFRRQYKARFANGNSTNGDGGMGAADQRRSTNGLS